MPEHQLASWTAYDIKTARRVHCQEDFVGATTLHLLAYSKKGAIIPTKCFGEQDANSEVLRLLNEDIAREKAESKNILA